MNNNLILGRLIFSDATRFRFACSPTTLSIPKIGDLVCAQSETGSEAYGIIANISWQSDDLISQLARQPTIQPGIISDNQIQRATGQWIDVLIVGFKDPSLQHMLAPRPPFSLERVKLCSQEEIVAFTAGTMAYFRLILAAQDFPSTDILVGFLCEAHFAQTANSNPNWIRTAVDYLTELLIADYQTLVGILETLALRLPDEVFREELE
jgi:hypothetical protein